MKKKAEEVILPKEMKKNKVEIKMYLHQASSSVPERLKGGSSHKSTVELIHRTLPQRWGTAKLGSQVVNRILKDVLID